MIGRITRFGVIGSSASDPVTSLLYAWFGGGYFAMSTVERIKFSSDTATATARGPLSSSRGSTIATGNTTDAWFGGGTPSAGPSGVIVDRIIFLSDSATAVAKGPLSESRDGAAATGNTTDGWFAGGRLAPQNHVTCRVDRIIFASDTATAVARGSMSTHKYLEAATGNTTDGWYGAGFGGVPHSTRSFVERVIFSSDMSTAVTKGPLSEARYALAAHGNTTDGWYGGGHGTISTVDRIIFASDTATAVVKGPLISGRGYLAAGGNTTDAWFGGGPFGGPGVTVDRVIFSSDTATAVAKGPLSVGRYGLAAN